jgi:predicted lysophospholipase L1 biosynthesis ABC-type transport system permease subunit
MGPHDDHVSAARRAGDRPPCDDRLRTAWLEHRVRVSPYAAYATVTVAVLAGLLGLMPMRDVIAAVVAAALGILFNAGRAVRPKPTMRVDCSGSSWAP